MTSTEWYNDNARDFELRADCIKACSDDLDISLRSARGSMKVFEDNGNSVNWKEDTEPKVKNTIDENGVGNLSFLSKVPVNVDELIALAGLDEKIFEVDRGRVGFWGNEKNANFQHRCKYRRKYNLEVENTIEFLNEHLKVYSPSPVIKHKPSQNKDLMAEIMLPDLHLGRVNTAGSASLKIVKEEFENAINYFIENVLSKFDIKKIVLVLGNDFFNCSSVRLETFKGTKQTEHPIWEETFEMGVKLAIDTILKIQNEGGCEIEIVNCVGNHDFESSYYLSQIIETYFRDNSMVTIQGNLDYFKFTKFGVNLIGYTHRAPNGKSVSLPLLMADRKPKEWANSKVREWHVAHIHHKTTNIEHKDVNGVRIKSFPTVTAHSDWENNKGYNSKREGTLMLWDSEKGCIAEFYYKNLEI